ncbi:MAG TPA: cobalamin-independent methionine synthase II family protein [Stellaceae bacterium]|nr:cobalamin-independent methionine synthase II family protein [Stellaceae bacterium]
MKRSEGRILTTHVGSLPITAPLDRASAGYEAELRAAVRDVVARQRATGIDIVNEGEYTKGGNWLSYLDERFGGFEVRPDTDGAGVMAAGRDREVFADFYRYAGEKGTLFYAPGSVVPAGRRPTWVCTGPVTYRAHEDLKREIDTLKAAAGAGETFLTSTAPASLEPYRSNAFYRSEEEFLGAIGEALREEYEAIAASGLILQVDDAWLPALWDRIGIGMGLDAFRRRSMLRIDVLNHALRNIPEDRIRYHLCWGSWHGPHAFDIEMKDFVDVMLRVKAGAYSFEAANARHEHEYEVWESVKLPPGKILIPGVITHSTDVVEHPRLVAQRIERFARLVGRENVIAGTDCGFGGRSHPQIAWAKLKSLAEGAAIASKSLFG